MALARIITRSHACSRELALDLLARGYAVEIVAPDKVPDNIADLELRVDAGPGDRLIANVEARDGERVTSLEFVHHLKAPMLDFMRRPPELGEAVHFSGEPVSFNAAPGIGEMEPADAPQLVPRAVSPATEILLNREIDPGIDPEEGARLIAPQVLSPPPVEPPGYFAVEDAAVPQPTMAQATIVPPTQATQRCDRSAGWPRHAALTFASVVLLAVVLGFSMRRTSKGAAQSSEALPVEKIAAVSVDVNPLSAVGAEKDPARDPGQVSAVPLPTPVDSEGNSSHAPKEAQVAKGGVPTASSRTAVSRKRGDDLIAPDTVTYLDKRFEPAPKAKPAKPLARRHPKSHTHGGGVIATNTVTYPNKPAPKTAK
jgi:hypothetical protein